MNVLINVLLCRKNLTHQDSGGKRKKKKVSYVTPRFEIIFLFCQFKLGMYRISGLTGTRHGGRTSG